jgi:hypothetical protein
VILSNDKLFKFNEQGGSYDDKTGLISGTGINGDPFSLSFEKLKEVRISKPETISMEEIKNQKSTYIAEVISKQHHLVCTFDSNGGRYEPGERLVIGITASGRLVEINADDILYARVSRADPARSILVFIGVLAVGFAIVVGIATATKYSDNKLF